jgi:hypothetical protein
MSIPTANVGSLSAGSETQTTSVQQDKVLPLPGWLTKAYFIFPVVLYIPDAIFNYFVYSDGAFVPGGTNPILAASQVALWSFMSIGVVGMAYLLSVLAPWHWGQGHRIQAFFCGVGVVVATAITTWNSLAFRSTHFQTFATDRWADSIWPQLHTVSLTMILVAIAPPFWGLFWAVVQPTQTGRSLRQLQETHAERLLRLQHEAELKSLKAEANAKVRTAQLRGMAVTAAAARDQAANLLKGKGAAAGTVVEGTVVREAGDDTTGSDGSGEMPAIQSGRVLQLPSAKGGVRGTEVAMYNHAAAATPTVHSAPANPARVTAAQPKLIAEADVAGTQAQGDPSPWPARRLPAPGGGIMGTIFNEDEPMTGTTGPRAAIRRPGESGALFRGISEEMPPKALAAVQEAFDELSHELQGSTRKTLPKKELVARVMARLNVDEPTAQKLVEYWRGKRNQRS